MKKFLFFCLSGAVGFVIDATFFLLAATLFPYAVARLISFFTAVFSTWIINRKLAFKNERAKNNIFNEFVKYFFSMLLGGSVNYFSFIILSGLYLFIKEQPIIGIGIGSALGLIFNFFVSKFIVFIKK